MRCLKSNSYEACADYLDKWGEKGKKNEGHFNTIRSKFGQLYKAKAKSCSTKEECEKFLKEHDEIMKRARMAGSPVDIQTSKIVTDKLKNLKNGDGNQTSQVNTPKHETSIEKTVKKPGSSLSKVKD
jgi:hypothetical protein